MSSPEPVPKVRRRRVVVVPGAHTLVRSAGRQIVGGMIFGLTVTLVVLLVALTVFGASRIDWFLLGLALLLSASAFSALGALVSVAVREVFEAQTLANVVRFPMMFLGGVFVPVDALPTGLQIVARLLPLTYAVEVIRIALTGTPFNSGLPDLAVLAGFTAVLFALAVRILGHHVD